MSATKFFIRSLPPKMGIPLVGLYDEQGDGYGRFTERSLTKQLLALEQSFSEASQPLMITDER